MKSLAWRLALTAGAIAVYGWVVFVISTAGAPLTARMAGGQFANSDVAYLGSSFGTRFVAGFGMPLAGLILALGFIWWKPTRQLVKWLTAAAVGVALASATPADAFFSDTDRTEAYTILPNESAFWIPDVGANMTSQGQFDSEAYLNAHKVALKRFVIPHQKLAGTGGNCIFCGWDDYVPTGRLIIVDRTPYSREWVSAASRGTSPRNEGFPCQSKEGLNITVGISIGTEVSEANAARYLYHFGVTPPSGDRSDPKVIFTSVYYSRTVADVMDDVGRKEIQTLVCGELSARSFDDDNAQAKEIMAGIRQAATAYFASVGITLDFIGWADTFTFDPVVQDAINRRYAAEQDKAIATALAPYADTIEKLAAAQALRSFGDHTDGKLPQTIVGLPANVGALLNALLGNGHLLAGQAR